MRLAVEIQSAHQRTRGTYGAVRLQSDLAGFGVFIGIDRIKRIRRKLGIRCVQKRKFKATAHSNHTLPVAPNLLARDFIVSAPNRAWASDITYIPTNEGWLLVPLGIFAGIKDLYSGELVGYALSERMTKTLSQSPVLRRQLPKTQARADPAFRSRQPVCALDYQKYSPNLACALP